MKLMLTAPAKVNLHLRITGRREDGFHEISSLFAMIDLFDLLVIEPAGDGKITLTLDAAHVPAGEGNIICRAAETLRQQANTEAGAKINLTKNIPVSAGLGGGSSDAAMTLIGLNRLWKVGLDRRELMAIGATIGSDVPFFLGDAASWVTGRGEKLKTVAMQKSLPLLLVKPAFGISAGDAYWGSDFDFDPVDNSEKIIEDFATGSPEKIAKHLHNDLEPWAIKTHPELLALEEKVKETGPVGVLMSGSGSTLFALYENEAKLEQAHIAMQGKASFILPAKTLLETPECVVLM